MNRSLLALLGAAGLLTLALIAAPVAIAGDPCYHGYSIPPATTTATTTIRMDPCAFVPTNAQVRTGSTVTFSNASEMPHLLTGANAAWGDRDQLIQPGGVVTVSFDEPGVYAFSCALHKGMSGAIIVGDTVGQDGAAAAPVASSTPNDSPGGAAAAVAITGLAVLAALGWAAALRQRRRPMTAEAPRVPVA